MSVKAHIAIIIFVAEKFVVHDSIIRTDRV